MQGAERARKLGHKFHHSIFPPKASEPHIWTPVLVKYQLELDMEQQTGSKLGKEYLKAVYCHTAYST